MDKVIQKLKLINDWTLKFQTFNFKNNLINNPSIRLQDQNIEGLMKHLLKMQINLYSRSQQKNQKHKISWVSSQYQALEIILNSLSVISLKIIEDFSDSEWSQVYKIFVYKLPLTIKYESLRIVQDKKQARRRWCASEQNFLIEIVKRLSRKNKWNDVARQLFIKSEGQFFRQGKHCRQRWINHLHPAIQNNDWSKEEDIKLLSFVLKKGKKWARIAKKFEMKRSQCMVKKRFYELVNIEEQDNLSIETMKNHIKIALLQLKEDINSKSEEIKQTDKFQQDVDKNQRKCSISKETLKIDGQQILLRNDIKIQEQCSNKQCPHNQNIQGLEFNHYGGLNSSQNYYVHQMNNESAVQDSFNSYISYVSFLTSMLSPFYGHCSPVIVPIQNNIIINQGNQKQTEFQKF